MSDDLQADFVSNVGGTIIAFDKITMKEIQLERQTRKTNQALDQQDKLLKKMTLSQGFKQTGKAFSLAGGSAIGRVFGGLSMGDGFGAAAISLTLLSVAVRKLSAASEEATDAARIEAETKVARNKAIAQGNKEVDQLAKAGYDRAPSRRALLAAGGTSALKAADALTGHGIVPADDARSVTAKVFARFGDTSMARAAMATIDDLSKVGVPVNEALEEIMKSPGSLKSVDSLGKLQERIYRKHTGGKGSLHQAMVNVRGDQQLKSSANYNSTMAQMGPLQDAAAVADNGALAAKEVERAGDPVKAALNDLMTAQREHISSMQHVADAETEFARQLADVLKSLGIGKGSLRNQLTKEIGATFGEQRP